MGADWAPGRYNTPLPPTHTRGTGGKGCGRWFAGCAVAGRFTRCTVHRGRLPAVAPGGASATGRTGGPTGPSLDSRPAELMGSHLGESWIFRRQGKTRNPKGCARKLSGTQIFKIGRCTTKIVRAPALAVPTLKKKETFFLFLLFLFPPFFSFLLLFFFLTVVHYHSSRGRLLNF